MKERWRPRGFLSAMRLGARLLSPANQPRNRVVRGVHPRRRLQGAAYLVVLILMNGGDFLLHVLANGRYAQQRKKSGSLC